MAKITSRSQLNVGTEITLNKVTRKFTLHPTGNLVAKDKVSLRALWSKFIDLWDTPAYKDSPFPMNTIDYLSGQFQFGTDGYRYSGWGPADDATRQMLADGGWDEFNAAGVMARQYVGAVGLGQLITGTQPYFQRAPSDAPTFFTFDDQCNEGIQVYGNAAADPTTTTFDKRAYFKGFVRKAGAKYRESTLADTGKTGTGAFIVNLLLSNEPDDKIVANDAAMSGAPYSGITVTTYNTNQNRSIGGVNYPFRIIVDGNGATLEQIHTKLQYLLRQPTDIDSGANTLIGLTADLFGSFLGDTYATNTGVYIDNMDANDTNRVIFKDQNGVDRTNPFVAAGSIKFNAPLVGADSSFRLMYKSPDGAGNDYGELGAVTVLDANGNPIEGEITSDTIGFTFDYDNNTQAGFAAGTDRDVVLVGVRRDSAKYATAEGTITRSKGITLSLTAEIDRAYI